MRLILSLMLLLATLAVQAQSYTVTESNCRVYFSNALDREAFWVDQLLWRHVGSNPDQLQIFDGISAITVQDANLVNYPTTDSLITQLEAWVVECDTAGQVVPVPGPEALFANSKSIDLDGTAEYVTVADADDLSMIEGGSDIPFSVSAWVYCDALASSVYVLSKAVNTSNREFWFFINTSGDAYLNLYDLTSVNRISRGVTSTTTADFLNKWRHLTATFDGTSTIKVYLDGVRVDDTDNNGGSYFDMHNTASNIEVGALSWSEYANAKLDQVCLFRNVELSLEEIKELMTIRDVTQFTYYDSLVLYQEYDNDTTGTDGITDLSPAGNNGTMQAGEYADLNTCITWPYDYQLDTTDNWANLTPMQSAADTSFGGFGWDFDGLTKDLTGDDFANLRFEYTDPFSVSAWVKTTDSGTDRVIFSKIPNGTGTTGNNGYAFRMLSTGFPRFIMIQENAGNNFLYIDGTKAINDGQWHHVVFTNDGSRGLKMYTDGIDYTGSGSTIASPTIGNARNVRIAEYDGGGSYWSGEIGDVSVFNKELSAGEISQIWNAHAPRNESNESLAGNILAYWRGYNSTNGASNILDQGPSGYNMSGANMEDADFAYTYPREIFDADTAGSVDFDGLADYIEIADSDSLSMLTQAGSADTSFSISIWADIQALNTVGLLGKGLASNDAEYDIWVSGAGTLFFICRDASASASINQSIAGLSFTAGFEHYVFTYDGSGSNAGMKIYENGVLLSSTGGGSGSYTAMENKTMPTQIGFVDIVNYYMNGYQSHVTIMKGIELTLCQIQEIYNDGSPVDPRDWTFWSDNFIHYKLNQDEDLEATEGVTNISPNGSCNGTGQSMTNAANKITNLFPTN